jgi:DNA invertase Pin-like site-specific DNA recombinase
LQDARSITDQVRLARKYAEGRGLVQVGIYEDAAISGASVLNRPGLQRLLTDADARKFDVVITESLDRLSRSQADIAHIYERLHFLGVAIETLADGRVNEMHVGLKGTMSAMFLKDLAQKTKRGQIGRVKAGRIPGGKSYGYDVAQRGEDRGQRIINAREAAIVRRIYEEYAAGKGSMAIVKGLNAEKEPGPSGGAWNVSAIIGSPKRKNGILNNELYKGTIAYNRQRFMKDPATGKRVSRVNPESEWLRQEVPELRIVDDELWHRVQSLRDSRSTPHFYHKRRPQRLLSGLIYCGCCGAKYNIAMRDYMRCSAKANSGMCSKSRTIRMCDVEQRVLRCFEEKLFTPKLVEAAASAYRDDFAKSHGARDFARSKIAREHADVDRKLSRLLRMVEDGHADPAATGPRVNELSAEKRRLAAQLAMQPEEAPVFRIPDEVAAYRQTLANLRVELEGGSEPALEASRLMRTFVRRVIVLPGGDGGDQPLEIEAGSSINMPLTDQYCEAGCGGWI